MEVSFKGTEIWDRIHVEKVIEEENDQQVLKASFEAVATTSVSLMLPYEMRQKAEILLEEALRRKLIRFVCKPLLEKAIIDMMKNLIAVEKIVYDYNNQATLPKLLNSLIETVGSIKDELGV